MRFKCFNIFLFIWLAAAVAFGNLTISATRADLYQVLGNQAFEQMARMIENQYAGLDGINVSDPVKPLHICIKLFRSYPGLGTESGKYNAIYPNGETTLDLRQILHSLSDSSAGDERRLFLRTVITEFDKKFPNYIPSIDTRAQAAELEKSSVLQWTRPDWRSLGVVNVAQLLNQFVHINQKFECGLYFVDMTGNCGSWALAAISETLPDGPLRKINGLRFHSILTSTGHFESVERPLQFGDVVFFDIVRNFHAAIYIGTDQHTGKEIVFTKNGRGPVFPMFMALDDLEAHYRNKFEVREVSFHRPLIPYVR